MKPADRMSEIPFSGIRKVFEEVKSREKKGEKIIHLEIGRPDFDTPLNIKEAAKKAIDLGKIHYTSNYGEDELREAISNKLAKENGVSYDPASDIIVTAGTNEAVFMVMMALLNPGDEVLILEPCWLHYFYCAQMAGAKPISVPLKSKDAFQPQMEVLETSLSSRTKMIVINTPHNPTGVVFSNRILEKIGDFAEKNDLYVLSDEIYEKIIYGKRRHVSFASLGSSWPRTLTVNGFSKLYSMTGWRIGYVAAPKELISNLIRIHQYTIVCATSFAQWGAIEALRGPQNAPSEMVYEFGRRRDLVCDKLKSIPKISFIEPQGTFYVFPEIKNYGLSDLEMAEYLLDAAKVSVVPGRVFGESGSGHIRISFANSFNNLEIAMNQIKDALSKL